MRRIPLEDPTEPRHRDAFDSYHFALLNDQVEFLTETREELRRRFDQSPESIGRFERHIPHSCKNAGHGSRFRPRVYECSEARHDLSYSSPIVKSSDSCPSIVAESMKVGPWIAGKSEVYATLGYSLVHRTVVKIASLQEGVNLVWAHPQVCAEIQELSAILRTRVNHVHKPRAGRTDVPLEVHARYTRLEILAAFSQDGRARVAPWQTGVLWLAGARTDLFAFTLDKADGAFSPTTRYRDYAVSPELIHWESQSVIRADSDTGLRYQRHAEQGSDVMLFARLRQRDRAFWFLGSADYVRHTGECPMAVIWRLRQALPGDLYAAFAAAVA